MSKLGIHNGTFHADDVFCVALMQGIDENLEVIRTRDESLLAACDVVADVGNGKYDHHHVDKKRRVNGIPYCAFGLLWEDFGKDYVKCQFPMLTDEKEQEEVTKKVDLALIEQIDAQDNGVDVIQSEVTITTLCDIINSYLPSEGGEAAIEKAFKEAIDFAKVILYKTAKNFVMSYEHKRMLKTAITTQKANDTHILVLEQAIPWKETILEIDSAEEVLFVVYPDVTGSWCTQVVPKEVGSFAARKNLPQTWGGTRNEELSALTGISECIFCHPALFICGNKNKEGAIAMAELAVAGE